MCANKIRGSRRTFQVTRLTEDLRRARISRNHQAVPGSDNFIVEMRSRPFTADREKFFSTLF